KVEEPVTNCQRRHFLSNDVFPARRMSLGRPRIIGYSRLTDGSLVSKPREVRPQLRALREGQDCTSIRTVRSRSAIICFHVRTLPIVAAETACRGILRDCRLARRLVAPIQHRSDSTHPGDPAASKGTCPADFADEVGIDSELGARCFDC